jgi:hypothetical protein
MSRLIPYAKEIIGNNQCGFRSKNSTTDHIFCIRQILEKKWEYNKAAYQLLVDYRKIYDYFRRGVSITFSLSWVSPRNW